MGSKAQLNRPNRNHDLLTFKLKLQITIKKSKKKHTVFGGVVVVVVVVLVLTLGQLFNCYPSGIFDFSLGTTTTSSNNITVASLNQSVYLLLSVSIYLFNNNRSLNSRQMLRCSKMESKGRRWVIKPAEQGVGIIPSIPAASIYVSNM